MNRMNTIEEAIEDFREGKFLIVVDDEDRENEGVSLSPQKRSLRRRSILC